VERGRLLEQSRLAEDQLVSEQLLPAPQLRDQKRQIRVVISRLLERARYRSRKDLVVRS